MKFKFALAPVVALLAITSQMAMAATSADLSVTGNIAPSACEIGLSYGGVFNFGDIPNSTLGLGLTKLPSKGMGLDITCSSATLIGLRATDNRGATLLPGLGGAGVTFASGAPFGLGVDKSANKIGGMSIFTTWSDVIVDGAPGGQRLVSLDNGATWSTTGGGAGGPNGSNRIAPGKLYSYAPTSASVPTPVTTVGLGLAMFSIVASKNDLDLTSTVTLDGSVTMELIYL